MTHYKRHYSLEYFEKYLVSNIKSFDDYIYGQYNEMADAIIIENFKRQLSNIKDPSESIHFSPVENILTFQQQPYQHHGGNSFDVGMHLFTYLHQDDEQECTRSLMSYQGFTKLYKYRFQITANKPLILFDFSCHPDPTSQYDNPEYSTFGVPFWSVETIILKITEAYLLDKLFGFKQGFRKDHEATLAEAINLMKNIDLKCTTYGDERLHCLFVKKVLNLLGFDHVRYINATEGFMSPECAIVFDGADLKLISKELHIS